MNYKISAGWMNTPEWRIFRRWQNRAISVCVDLCGISPDEVPIEAWASYFDDGLSSDQAGALMAACLG